jgi:hypothetical protein
MPEPLYRHPSRSEIIELAVAEGHDADVPSNIGSLHRVPSIAPSHKSKHGSPAALEKDIEKGAAEEASESDPNIVFWDGPDDPQNPMNWPALKKWGTKSPVSTACLVWH